MTNQRRGGRIPPNMPIEIATNSGGPWFRAYDKTSGAVVWEIEMEAGTTNPPISYVFNDRQYLLVAIGDSRHAPEIVAFALPE